MCVQNGSVEGRVSIHARERRNEKKIIIIKENVEAAGGEGI